MSKPQFYTTSIDPTKTANEIGEAVRRRGASRFQIEWDGFGRPSAIAFATEIPGMGEVPVRLMAQTAALKQRMIDERILPGRANDDDYEDQACRTAWRQLRGYVLACMEMVENGIKPFHEVFLADVVMAGGDRVVERFEALQGRLLDAPDEVQVLRLPTG